MSKFFLTIRGMSVAYRWLCMLLLTSTLALSAQGQVWQWGIQRSLGSQEMVRDITYSNDPNGGIVVAEFKQSTVSNAGTFITKFSTTGTVIWSQPVRLARANTNLNYSITVEDIQPTTGGYFVAGWLPKDSTITFGTTVLTAPASGQTLYRAFLSESGAWQTGVIATYSGRAMESMLLRTDANGSVYVAGLLGPGTASFGSQTVTVPVSSNAALEYVVAACNPGAGGWTWATVTTTTHKLLNGGPRYISDMTVKYGTVWLTGIISGSPVSFPRASGPALTLLPGGGTIDAGGNRDVFLAAASGGSWSHASNFANDFSNNGTVAGKLAIDGGENVYVTGYSGSANANGVSLPGGTFVASFNSFTSAFQWAREIPSSYYGYNSLANNENGTGIILSGNLSGSFTFGNTTLTPSVAVSGFVSRITSAGTWQWTVGFGGTNSDLRAKYLNTHSSDVMYLAGEYNGTSLTLGSTVLPVAQNGGDIYVAKLTEASAPTITILNPTSGTIGDVITLTGTNLTGTTSITFTGTSNQIVTSGFTVNVTGTQITGVVVPDGARTGTISVATPGGTATSTQVFTVISTWTGAVSSDWATPGNWQGGTVPSLTERATIGPAPRMPVVSGNQAVAILGLFSGAYLTIADNSSLSLYGDLPENDGQAGLALHVLGDQNAIRAQPTGLHNGVLRFVGANRQKIDAVSGSQYHFANVYVGPAGIQLYRISAQLHGLLTLDGDVDTNNAHAQDNKPLVLVSDNAGTALFVNNGNNAILGNVTVQRYVSPDLNPGLGYRHFSAPVGSATVASLATGTFTPIVNAVYNGSATPALISPFPTVYGYEQSRLASVSNTLAAFDKGWFSPASLSDGLNVGLGYTVNLAANQTVSFTGPQNNASTQPITLNLMRNATGSANELDAGWQLVGNPFPSPLDYSLVTASDRTGLDAAIYINESRSQYGGTYRAYTNGVGGNPVLALGQGFFVRVSTGQTAGTLNFRNSQRVTSYQNPAFSRTMADLRPLVHLTLQSLSGGVSDQAYVYFEQGATDSFDAQYDAVKLPNTTGLNLSTTLADQQLSIDGRSGLGTAQRVVPLAVGVPAPGSYEFTAAQLLNLNTVPVYLRDLQTGAMIDLAQQPTYRFMVSNASALLTGRFELVFSPQQALATVPASLAAQVGIYPNPTKSSSTVIIDLPAGLVRQAVTADVLDALGRPVHTQVLPTGVATPSLLLAKVATGIYFLRLTTSVGVVVKKLLIE